MTIPGVQNFGTSANDRIDANPSQNVGILGMDGDDFIFTDGWIVGLYGQNGNDVLELNGNSSSGTGGPGNDYFVIGGPGTNVEIRDFEDGIDKIAIINGADGVSDYDDLSFSQSGADAIVSLAGNDNLILKNTNQSVLDSSDFIFGNLDTGSAPKSAAILPPPIEERKEEAALPNGSEITSAIDLIYTHFGYNPLDVL